MDDTEPMRNLKEVKEKLVKPTMMNDESSPSSHQFELTWPENLTIWKATETEATLP